MEIGDADYYCVPCQFSRKFKSDMDLHKKTQRHAKNVAKSSNSST